MTNETYTTDTVVKPSLTVPSYDQLLEMLEQFELKGGKYINSQRVMTAFAQFYASHGIYVFRVHVPLFNENGECVACSCEDFRTSQKCRDEYPHLYLKNGERCQDQGKCPMFGGINDSTIDPQEITEMFKPVRVKNIVTGKFVSVVPNIGIDTGKSDLLGYDDDSYKKVNGSTLEDDFAPEEIDTVRVISGSRKGTHLWFAREGKPYKSKTRSKDGKVGEATDVRGVNGYLVGPPSIHKTNNRYEFFDGQILGQVSILPIPQRIDEVLKAAYSAATGTSKKDSKPDPEAVKRSKALVDGILTDNSIEHTEWEEYPLSDGQGWRLKLKHCPFNDENDPHTDHNVAYIAIHQDGCINAFCPHNRCQKQIEAFGTGWGLFRKIMAKPTSAQAPAKKLTVQGNETPKKRLPATQYRAEVLDGEPLQTGWSVIWTHEGKEDRVKIKQCLGDKTGITTYTIEDSGAIVPETELIVEIREKKGAQTQRKVNPDTGEIYGDDVLAEPIGLDQVLAAIGAIRDDGALTPDQRRTKIATTLAQPIGEIDKAYRIEVEAALAGANAGFSQTKATQYVKDCASTVKKQRKEAQRAVAQAKQSVKVDTGKPFIEVGDRQLRDVISDVTRAVEDYNAENPNHPAMYINNGRVVRVIPDDESIKIGAYAKPSAKHLFSRLADFGTVHTNDETGEEKITGVYPPDDVVASFLDMGDWPVCPPLDGIVTAPVFSKNGELQTEQGYSQKTRLYLAGSVVLGDTIPTDANVAAARSLLMDDLFVDFPFKDDASKANAVAFTILPFVRQLIQGQTPMTLVNSPTPGTGKTKVLVVGAYPFLGTEVGLSSECEDDAEWRKSITSMLLAGKSHYIIDNVNHGLDSGILAKAITSGVHDDRLLGGNQQQSMRVRTIIASTGNNVPLTDELARRCALIDLDANVERPEKREGFKHELPEWAREHRDELVTAIVTLVKAWIARGKPNFQGRQKGSFEQWSKVIGGILQVAGIPGFLENEDALFEMAVGKNQAVGEFVKAWFDKFGRNPVASKDLFKLASYSDNNDDNRNGEWMNLLADFVDGRTQQSRATKLGNLLKQNRNKVVAGHKVVDAGTSHGYQLWKLLDPKEHNADNAAKTYVPPVITPTGVGSPLGVAPDLPDFTPTEPPPYVGNGAVEPEAVTWTL